MAWGEHAVVDRKHHDDGAGHARDAGGVRSAAASARQLDLPRHWRAGWVADSDCKPACAASALRVAGVVGDCGGVLVALARTSERRALRSSWTPRHDYGRYLPPAFSEDPL